MPDRSQRHHDKTKGGPAGGPGIHVQLRASDRLERFAKHMGVEAKHVSHRYVELHFANEQERDEFMALFDEFK